MKRQVRAHLGSFNFYKLGKFYVENDTLVAISEGEEHKAQ
jgi:hypothetical protein